jgi:capsule polysaccharide export protein KpsE/RkpR
MCYLISPVFVQQFVKHKTYQISEKILSNKGYLINQMNMQMQQKKVGLTYCQL